MYQVTTAATRSMVHKCGRFAWIALLLVSVVLNVLLSQELRAARTPVAAPLDAGTPVPTILGVTPGGAPMTVSYDAGLPTVLYYFSADCVWCERNWANVEALVIQTRGRYRVVGVAASPEVPGFLKDRAVPLPIVTGLDAETLAAYGFSGTPQTVVVAPGGRVLKSWMGAYQKDQSNAVAGFFDVELPGLLPKAVVK